MRAIPSSQPFIDRVQYFAMNFDDDAGYRRLKKKLAEMDEKFSTQGNRLFYLAVAPEYFSDIVSFLGKHGMNKPREGANHWVRTHHRKAVWPRSRFSARS